MKDSTLVHLKNRKNLYLKHLLIFATLSDTNLGADPSPPSCRTETRYEQMFFLHITLMGKTIHKVIERGQRRQIRSYRKK